MAGSVEATPPAPRPPAAGPRIGVLAIQGDFEAHAEALRRLGAVAVKVRRPAHLDGLDGLIVPGGESTTMSMGLESYGLEQPIRNLAATGLPVFGTCAGLIVLDRSHLGVMDMEARRNAFGRQVRSFEAHIPVRGLGDEPLRAVFIRAPWIEDAGDGVEVLAEIDGHPVVARERNMLVAAFHPELTDDLRLHALFLGMVAERRETGAHA
ncbi:MAG: pyridoxal 5'-phosphate synthase glutaminase subunit PdxT [Solirubrobacterales bacterium]